MGANKKPDRYLRCSYRHPKKFYQYIDKMLTKIFEENKLVFCLGDQFNVNLSNYNVYTHTNEFLTIMIHIIYCPTDHSASIVDNIFSKNTVHEAIIEIIIP